MSTGLPQFASPRREAPGVELTRRLLDYLLSGDVKPGQRIPSERQLATALSAGRSTVREAIKSLSLLGLLEQRVGDGTYLSRSSSDLLPQVIEWGLLLGEKRLEDLLEARSALEVQLAGWAAERRTEAQLAELRRLIAKMGDAGEDFESYVEADIAFHLWLAEASGNGVLASVLTNIQSLLQAWASRVIRTAGETETSLAMHEPILAAVEARDPDAARSAMLAHMERATRRLRASLPADDDRQGGTGAR
ncbi:FadR/GntR family transcriptional regulator [Actinomadura viridis]|uniref:GntR family transcriptional repressor for pyruvate dehydrogenase complex n=1 Tax=Actinomadura viridis TaxID=58110 RepID=A0A931DH61_9ACTN|nr:FadR/GntR family transcriptional regulator [Actinomadura viridis]MBG6091064.1 GntR family transcriptional repressor for pyruvate dehydrogenase complex [Actinomadura viridis]